MKEQTNKQASQWIDGWMDRNQPTNQPTNKLIAMTVNDSASANQIWKSGSVHATMKSAVASYCLLFNRKWPLELRTVEKICYLSEEASQLNIYQPTEHACMIMQVWQLPPNKKRAISYHIE